MASRKMHDKLIFAEANQLGWYFVLNGSSLKKIINHFVLLSLSHLSDPKRWCGLPVFLYMDKLLKFTGKIPSIELSQEPVLDIVRF